MQGITFSVSRKYQDTVSHDKTMDGEELLILTGLKGSRYCKADSTALVAIPKNGFCENGNEHSVTNKIS